MEEAVADYYKNVELSPELRMQTEQKILEQIAELREDSGAERTRLVTRSEERYPSEGSCSRPTTQEPCRWIL